MKCDNGAYYVEVDGVSAYVVKEQRALPVAQDKRTHLACNVFEPL